MRHLDGDELLSELEHRPDELVEHSLVVVECGHVERCDPTVVEKRLAGVPAVFVATAGPTSPLARALDLVATDADDIARCARAVDEHREAAIALAVLLRGERGRAVRDGLVAESSTYSMLQASADHRRWLAGRPARRPLSAESSDVVQMRRNGDVLHITLDRPRSHNAFSAAMRDALLEALAVVAADESTTAIIDATGPSFCSGGDLGEFGTSHDVAAAHLLRLRRSVGRAMHEIADRVTVVVHGHCVGAGVELPSFAGRVVARPDATFCLPELSMGLIPGAGGTVSIPRRIGRQRTLRLALWGEPIDASVANEWGLVDSVSPSS